MHERMRERIVLSDDVRSFQMTPRTFQITGCVLNAVVIQFSRVVYFQRFRDGRVEFHFLVRLLTVANSWVKLKPPQGLRLGTLRSWV